jgi:hypothetical protein
MAFIVGAASNAESYFGCKGLEEIAHRYPQGYARILWITICLCTGQPAIPLQF